MSELTRGEEPEEIHPHLRVLLVDDDHEVLHLLTEGLTVARCQVDCVETVWQASVSLQHQPYDLVMVELELFEIPGLDLVDALQHTRFDGVLIAISANHALLTHAKQRGAFTLAKPFDLTVFIRALRNWLGSPVMNDER